MYIEYLFKNRKKTKFLSREWFRLWAKRFYCIGRLSALEFNAFKVKGCDIGALSVLSNRLVLDGKYSNLRVGVESSVGSAYFQLHDRIDIGSWVVINEGVRVITGSHDVDDDDWKQINKPVVIMDNVWIAMGAIILQGVVIGEGAVVAAGSVVSKDIPPFAIVGGNPARVIRYRKAKKLAHSPVSQLVVFNAWLDSAERKFKEETHTYE